MSPDVPGSGVPAAVVHPRWAGVITEWVRQQIEPLVPTGRRLSTESRLVDCCSRDPLWAVIVLGGVIADLVCALPPADPVRQLGARIGPMSAGAPLGFAPRLDGAAPMAGLPVGFDVEFDPDGLAAQLVFGAALPPSVRAVLGMVGAVSGAVRDDLPLRPVQLEPMEAGLWAGALDVLGPADGLRLECPWVTASAALLMARRRAELDGFDDGGTELASMVNARFRSRSRRPVAGPAPAGSDDIGDILAAVKSKAEPAREEESVSATSGPGPGLFQDGGGRAMASTAASAVRWAMWNRRRYLPDSWPSDQWPARSAVRWSVVAELVSAGVMNLGEHWGIGELRDAAVGIV